VIKELVKSLLGRSGSPLDRSPRVASENGGAHSAANGTNGSSQQASPDPPDTTAISTNGNGDYNGIEAILPLETPSLSTDLGANAQRPGLEEFILLGEVPPPSLSTDLGANAQRPGLEEFILLGELLREVPPPSSTPNSNGTAHGASAGQAEPSSTTAPVNRVKLQLTRWLPQMYGIVEKAAIHYEVDPLPNPGQGEAIQVSNPRPLITAVELRLRSGALLMGYPEKKKTETTPRVEPRLEIKYGNEKPLIYDRASLTLPFENEDDRDQLKLFFGLSGAEIGTFVSNRASFFTLAANDVSQTLSMDGDKNIKEHKSQGGKDAGVPLGDGRILITSGETAIVYRPLIPDEWLVWDQTAQPHKKVIVTS